MDGRLGNGSPTSGTAAHRAPTSALPTSALPTSALPTTQAPILSRVDNDREDWSSPFDSFKKRSLPCAHFLFPCLP